jgi:hypothetical protein
MKSKPFAEASKEYLRSARPRLICRVDPNPESKLRFRLTPSISEVELGWDEVLDEGYDPSHSPLGCPVYWRIISRGDERFYCSTFLAGRAQVIKGWGTQGLAHCDPVTGMAVARLETNLSGNWPPIHDRELEEKLKNTAALRRMAKAEPKVIDNWTGIIPELLKEERLLNLTSALKTFHGEKTQAALPIFWHWVRINYDIAEATLEWRAKVKEGYLEIYRAAKPLERAKAFDVLRVYSEHFFNTATADERAAMGTALGFSPVEYEIRTEGFSMRELMQALKIFHNVPDDLLTACFERYASECQGRKLPITAVPQLIATYRREPAMKSKERARAILKAFGIKILNGDNPDDMKIWKQVSRAREH